MRILRLHFSLLISDYALELEDRTAALDRGKEAFASYATEDRAAVLGRIQGMQKLCPDLDVFLDAASMHPGDRWAKRIESEILARDTFYLFWSRFAKQSEWVEREWRFALEHKGLKCIDPVPLESPDVAEPPPELAQLHFNEWTLAYEKSSKG